MRYVAMGDSYTIGTSVTEADRWPNQLAARIDELELAGNLAVEGFTTVDLIEVQLPQLDALRPELVSVLIGVNDVVQRVPDGRYAAHVSTILDELLRRLPSDRILGLATPDYTRTPRGGDFGDPQQQSDGIVRVNAILREGCEQRDIRFVPEIFDLSQAAADDPSLVAADGLHPSGKQYRRWVDLVEPMIRETLARR